MSLFHPQGKFLETGTFEFNERQNVRYSKAFRAECVMLNEGCMVTKKNSVTNLSL